MRFLGPARFWMDDPPSVAPLRFRGAPMLFAALCFAAGDVLAQLWHTPLQLVAATALLLLLALFALRRRLRVAMWPVLAVWVAMGCWCAQMQPPVPTQHVLAQYADGLSRVVRGRVVRVRTIRTALADASSPQQPQEPWLMEPGAWEVDSAPAMESVDLQVSEVEDITPDVSTMKAVEGSVRITINGVPPQLACGDVLELPLRLRESEVYRDPGAWSYREYLLEQGIGAQANIKAEQVQRTGSSAGSWRCRVYAAQAWASERMAEVAASPWNGSLPAALRLDADDTAMLQAMLFGDRTMLSHPLRVGFERTGTFHLFVVSGLHVAIVAGALFWLLRRLRLPEAWAAMVCVVTSGGYALLTGFGPPVQRAWIMSAAFLIARIFGRERSALNALGAAALAVLAMDPRALFESSFQMTMLVIVALAGIAAPLEERWFRRWRDALRELWTVRMDATLPPATAQLRVRLRMWGSVCAGLLGRWARDLPTWVLRAVRVFAATVVFGTVAEICMMLPMALYFHRATLLALPLNAVCIPLVAVLLCSAIATFSVSLISATLAAIPGAVTAMLLHLVHMIVAKLGRVAVADVRVPMPAAAAVVLACVLIALCLWAVRARQRWWVAAAVGALAMVPVALLWPVPSLAHPGLLEVTALDVGQGDSLLVTAPDGHTLLVDAGGPVGRSPAMTRNAADSWDVGEEVVAPYLWSRHIRRLDAVLLTHAHSDHMGGMPAVLRDFRPRELWLSVQPGKAPALRALLSEAAELGVHVRWMHASDTFAWAGLKARVLSPQPGYANAGLAVNDDSLVMRLEYGKASVLLEGDAEARSENAMLAHGLVTPATLLKVGHHGSRTSTTVPFLAAVAPREAVVSVGAQNTFGHPRWEVLQRLEAAGVKTFRTDRAGAETFLLGSDGGISAASATSH